MRKVILLGGSAYQSVAVKKAKEMGLYTILLDLNPSCPGRKWADLFLCVSTNDRSKIIEIAKKEAVDGIICYESDQSIETASFCCEQLNLPGQPYQSVKIMQNKALFRKFLADNGFNVPKAKGYDEGEIAIKEISEFKFPVVVKPVDSCGSKGVTIVERQENILSAIKYALNNSKSKNFIIEEFVDKFGYQIAGDGFSVNGQLVFRCFANEHFDTKGGNKISPIGESFPYNLPDEIHQKIHGTIQKLFDLLSLKTGAYNFDIRINNDKEVFLMEVSPRNGGCLIPEVIKYATGFDEVEYTIKAALGDDCADIEMMPVEGFWSSYIIHGYEKGIIKDYWIDPEFENRNIVEKRFYRNIGDQAPGFDNTDWVCGSMILKYESLEEMLEKMDNMQRYVKIIV